MKIYLIFIILFIIGCASVSVQKYYKDKSYPRTDPSDIIIHPDKPEEKNYVELGEITVEGADNWTEVENVFKAKAAEMGADAVYVLTKQEEEKQYVSPPDCYEREGYYYPYQHFGWQRYGSDYYYPRGYYYCYGYRATVDTAKFLTAIGIAIKYNKSDQSSKEQENPQINFHKNLEVVVN